MNRTRTAAGVALALAVAAGAAIVVAPRLIAERGWASAVARTEAATRVHLTAEGPIEARLFPSPRVVAAGLRLSAPADGAGKPLAHADRAKIDIPWSAVLGGRLAADRIRVRGVRLLAVPPHPPVDVEARLDGAAATVDLSFEGGHGRATLLTDEAGIAISSMEFRAGASAGRGAGRLTLDDGLRLVLTFESLRFGDSVAARGALAAALASDGLLVERAVVRGDDGHEVAVFGHASAEHGEVRFEGGADARRAAGEGEFEAAARLSARFGQESASVGIDDLDLRLGGTRLTGGIRASLGGEPRLVAELRADRVDLARENASWLAALLPMLAVARGELRLRVGQVAWAGGAAEGAVLDIARDEAAFELRELAVRDLAGAPFHAAGKFSVDGRTLTADPLVFRHARVEGSGRLQVDFAASPLRLQADVATGPLILDRLMPPPPPLPPPPMTRRATAAAAATAHQRPRRAEWSREPIALPGLPPIDAELRLTAPRLAWRDIGVDDARLAGRLADGLAIVDALSGTAYGGRVELRGRAEVIAGARPSFAGTLRLTGLDLRALLAAQAGVEEISGRVDAVAELSAAGRSPAELIANLNGDLRLRGGEGAIAGFDLPAMSARLKQLQRPTDLVEVLRLGLGGVGRTLYRALTGGLRFERGTVRLDDMHLVASAGEMRTRGSIDISAWTLDLANEFRLTEHPDLPPFALKLSGPIETPRRVFDVERLQSSLVRRGRAPAR